jgi:hypothetical protein
VTTNAIRGALRALAVLVVTAALAVGCSSGSNLVPVEGTVYVDGTPVQTGEFVTGYVILHADTSRGNTNMEDTKGDIGPDGRYTIYTRDKKGTPPGWYFVTVDLARTNPKDPYDYKAMVSENYLDKTKSGLAFEVVSNPQSGRYDIRVESVGAKEKKK